MYCSAAVCASKAMPLVRQLIASLSSRSPRFRPRSVHVVFVVYKVQLGQVFLQVLQFSLVSIIPCHSASALY